MRPTPTRRTSPRSQPGRMTTFAILREPLCLLLALAAVLGERDGRALASLRQLVAESVVILGHVVITGQRTVVSDLDEPARLSLLEPARSGGGARRYSSQDLERLRRIAALVATGLNLAGVATPVTQPFPQTSPARRVMSCPLSKRGSRSRYWWETATAGDEHAGDPLISSHTRSSRVKSLRSKLGAQRQIEAVMNVVRLGLVQISEEPQRLWLLTRLKPGAIT